MSTAAPGSAPHGRTAFPIQPVITLGAAASPVETRAPFAARKHRLGVTAIAFMIIAASAPLTVIAGGATTAFSVTHVVGVPAAYIVLALALVVFAVGYTAMSRYVTNAGAFYAYIAQGLGRPVGVGASLLALVAYNAMQIGIYGMFGFQVSSLCAQMFGIHIPWWVPVAVGIAVVGWMGVNRVDLSAKVLGVLVACEFVAVSIFDVIAVRNPAQNRLSAVPFEPNMLLVTGAGAVLAFGIAAFMGFESAAIYSEEARDPARTVPRATFLAVAVIGVFYTVSSWALAMAVGPDTITDPDGISTTDAGPPLFFNFVATHLGPAWVDIMSLLFITSLFAALVSFHNAAARYFFALGREGVLPAFLAKVRRRYGIPWAGSVTQTVIAVVVIAGFALAGRNSSYGDAYPVVTLFSWLTNDGALGLVLLMAMTSVAVMGYFRRNRHGLSIWVCVVAPAVSFVALAAVFVLVATNFWVLLGQAAPDATTYILPAVVIGPGALGTLWALWLRRAKPAVYQQIGHGAEDLGSTPHPVTEARLTAEPRTAKTAQEES